MTIRLTIAAFAVLFCLCHHAYAATHPNTKKIAKWEGQITKIQAKIDAENARTPSGMAFVSAYVRSAPVVTYRMRSSVQYVQPAVVAPVLLVPTPAPVVEPAPEVQFDQATEPAPVVQYVQPSPVVQYVAPAPVVRARIYTTVRTYRAAPVLGCPIFGGVFGVSADGSTWSQRYHARQAARHEAKAAEHDAKAQIP